MKKFSKSIQQACNLLHPVSTGFLCVSFFACKKTEVPLSQNAESSSDLLLNKSASQFSSEVIDKWITMQLRLDRDAVGIPNVAFFRYCAYSGVAAFAAVAPGTNVGASFSGKLNQLTDLPQANRLALLYWPASVNTALAFMNQSMFTTATAIDKAAIDSLEDALNNFFLSVEAPKVIAASNVFGNAVATAVLNWSETDGYKHASDRYKKDKGKQVNQ